MLDLNQHTYRKELGTKGLSDPLTVDFPLVETALATKWSTMKTRQVCSNGEVLLSIKMSLES